MTLAEFQDLPALRSGFPLLFASGARWNEMTGHCARCERVIEPDNMRGTVTPWGPAHAVKVYVIRALGYCPRCELLTPFDYRLHQDMSMTGEKGGEWVRWPPPKPGLLARFRRWLRKVVS